MTSGFVLALVLALASVSALPGCTRTDGPPAAEITARLAAVRARPPVPAEREWRSYLGNAAVAHSSPLDTIDRENVSGLEVAWRYDSGGADPRGGSQIQFNPLVVRGILYGLSPTLRIFALDAARGEELWSFQPDVEVEIWTASRGAVYWSEGEEERLFFGAGPWLYALDPRSGEPLREFGDGGRIDLREGLGRDLGADRMGVVLTTPPALFEDLLIVGGRVNEIEGAAPGHVRAFDVRRGELQWVFHTIPQPGQFGAQSWPADAAETAGGANAWAGMSVDAARGLVFVPTGSAAGDFYGGGREGDNLFANSLIALDARSGERRWHYQVVRHDLWDRDLPAPPNLIELERGGQRIPAVAQITKTGDTFIFHRETGAPLFGVREEEVVGDPLVGEFPARTQPLPLLPVPFVRQGFWSDDPSDRTPAVQAAMERRVATLHKGAIYGLPSIAGTIVYPGLDGGAEWGGAAWDANQELLFVNANQVPWVVKMLAASADFDPTASLAGGYLLGCAGCHGADMLGDGAGIPPILGVSERISYPDLYRLLRDGRGRMPGFGVATRWWELAALAGWVYFADADDTPAAWVATEGPLQFLSVGYQKLVDAQGLPGSKPPWGTLTALDLGSGQIRWQVPLGDYPLALALGHEGLGAENYGGPVFTSGGLVFLAATPDAKIRAFDSSTGEVLWEAKLSAPGFATPAVYEADGREFVVVAAGGGKLGQPSGSEYIAFALPRDGTSRSAQSAAQARTPASALRLSRSGL
jgi:quinoprotein glucose dehydrogenase